MPPKRDGAGNARAKAPSAPGRAPSAASPAPTSGERTPPRTPRTAKRMSMADGSPIGRQSAKDAAPRSAAGPARSRSGSPTPGPPRSAPGSTPPRSARASVTNRAARGSVTARPQASASRTPRRQQGPRSGQQPASRRRQAENPGRGASAGRRPASGRSSSGDDSPGKKGQSSSKLSEQIDTRIPIPDDFSEFEGNAVGDSSQASPRSNKSWSGPSKEWKDAVGAALLMKAGGRKAANARKVSPAPADKKASGAKAGAKANATPLGKLSAYLIKRFKSPIEAFKALDREASDTMGLTTRQFQQALDRLQVPLKQITGKATVAELLPDHPKGDGKDVFWRHADLFGYDELGLPEPKLLNVVEQKADYDTPFGKLREYLLNRYKTPRKAFRALDSNDSGGVTFGEMEEALDRLKVPWRAMTGKDHIKEVFRGHPKAQAASGGEFNQVDLFGDDHGEDDDDEEEEDLPHYIETSFNERKEVEKFAHWAAFDNRWELLAELFKNPCNQFVDKGFYQLGRVSMQDFVSTCKLLKYDGDAKAIFMEILNKGLTMREQNNNRKQGVTDTILARQFQVFAKEARMLDGRRAAEDSHSAVHRFVQVLKKREGTFIRGWRQHVDLHGVGKVGFTVFSQGLRCLGLHTQVKPIWDSVRKNTNDPVSVHDFAREESDNLEEFVNLLWQLFGLNLEEAWDQIDPSHQNYVTLQEFAAGVHSFHFNGDAALLFKCLGDRVTNRLSKEEFMYIGKISSQYREKMKPCSHHLHPFIAWVQAAFGGPEALVLRLGFNSTQAISVADLAARLTSMGYTGDSLAVATRAARLEGGVSVTANSLQLLLAGKRRLAPAPGWSPMVMLTKSAEKQMPDWKQPPWNGRVDDFAHSNMRGSTRLKTPIHTRSYFGNLSSKQAGHLSDGDSPRSTSSKTPRGTAVRSQSECALSRQTRRHTIPGNENDEKYRRSIIRLRWKASDNQDPLKQKPDWNSQVYNPSSQNKEKSSLLKDYFMDPLLKPHKESILKKMEATAEKKGQEMRERNKEVFTRFMREASMDLKPGEKVLMALKMQIDAAKERTGHFMARLDNDGSGELDGDELRAAMERLGFELTDEDFSAMIEILDEDGSGDISLKELVKAMRNVAKKVEKLHTRVLAQQSGVLNERATIRLPNGCEFQPLTPRKVRRDPADVNTYMPPKSSQATPRNENEAPPPFNFEEVEDRSAKDSVIISIAIEDAKGQILSRQQKDNIARLEWANRVKASRELAQQYERERVAVEDEYVREYQRWLKARDRQAWESAEQELRRRRRQEMIDAIRQYAAQEGRRAMEQKRMEAEEEYARQRRAHEAEKSRIREAWENAKTATRIKVALADLVALQNKAKNEAEKVHTLREAGKARDRKAWHTAEIAARKKKALAGLGAVKGTGHEESEKAHVANEAQRLRDHEAWETAKRSARKRHVSADLGALQAKAREESDASHDAKQAERGDREAWEKAKNVAGRKHALTNLEDFKHTSQSEADKVHDAHEAEKARDLEAWEKAKSAARTKHALADLHEFTKTAIREAEKTREAHEAEKQRDREAWEKAKNVAHRKHVFSGLEALKTRAQEEADTAHDANEAEKALDREAWERAKNAAHREQALTDLDALRKNAKEEADKAHHAREAEKKGDREAWDKAQAAARRKLVLSDLETLRQNARTEADKVHDAHEAEKVRDREAWGRAKDAAKKKQGLADLNAVKDKAKEEADRAHDAHEEEKARDREAWEAAKNATHRKHALAGVDALRSKAREEADQAHAAEGAEKERDREAWEKAKNAAHRKQALADLEAFKSKSQEEADKAHRAHEADKAQEGAAHTKKKKAKAKSKDHQPSKNDTAHNHGGAPDLRIQIGGMTFTGEGVAARTGGKKGDKSHT